MTATSETSVAQGELAERASVAPGRVRLDHVDAVRPVKQFGVVSTHSLLAFAPAANVIAGSALLLLHVSREAFFFISACMLTHTHPVISRSDLRRFYRRRAVTIVLPYLAWTLLYWVIRVGLPDRPADFAELVRLLSVGYHQLYYLVVIAQFYLLYPLISRLVHACRSHHSALLLSSLGLQLLLTSLMHWQVAPAWMRGYWATRELTSYQFYLLAGCVAAYRLADFERWLAAHARFVVSSVLATAIIAEAWYTLAVHHAYAWMGSPTDPFQPIVLPFNAAAIAALYLLGPALVSTARSVRFRRWVRIGADNAYGIFLAQMVFLTALVDLGWGTGPSRALSWPVLVFLAAALTFLAGGTLSWVLSHTALSQWLTGQKRRCWGQPPEPVQPSAFASVAGLGPSPPLLIRWQPHPGKCRAGFPQRRGRRRGSWWRPTP